MQRILLVATGMIALALAACHPPSSSREAVVNGKQGSWDQRDVDICLSGKESSLYTRPSRACEQAMQSFARFDPERAFTFWKRLCELDQGDCGQTSYAIVRAFRETSMSPATLKEFRAITEAACLRDDRVENSIGRDVRHNMCDRAIASYAEQAPREPEKAARLIAHNCSTLGDCDSLDEAAKQCKQGQRNCDIVAALPATDRAGAERIWAANRAEDKSRYSEVREERREAERADDERRAQEQEEKRQSQAALIGALRSVAAGASPTPVIVPARPAPVPSSVHAAGSSRPSLVLQTPTLVQPPPPPGGYLLPCGTALVLPTDPPERKAKCGGSNGSGSSGPTANPSGGTTPSAGPSYGGGGGNGGAVANGACTNMDGAVSFTSSRPTGPGHCAGEIVGHVTNRSSQPVDCLFAFYSNGVKTADGGGGTVAPGQTTGGEAGGLWSCGADTIKYACFPHSAASYGCKTNW